MERRTKLTMLFYFGLLLAILLLPFRIAYADGIQQPWNSVIYGPVQSGGLFGQPVYNDVGVCAWSRYDAAMTALGYSSTDINDFSSDVKVKLSNQSTGGRFWTFAQLFEEPSEDDYSMTGIAFRSYVLLYGEGNVWRGQYTTTQANDARTDADVILGGGSLGGGSDGGVTESGDYVLIPVTSWAPDPPETVNCIAVPKDKWASIVSYATEHQQQVLVYMGQDVSYGNNVNGSVMTAPADGVTFNINSLNRPYVLSWNYRWSAMLYREGWDNNSYQMIDGKNCYVMNRASLSTVTMSAVTDSIQNVWYYAWPAGGVGVEPSEPENNWPDTPDTPTPTPPTVPDPPTSTPVDPPSDPVGGNPPSFPIQIITTETTYPVADLQAVLDAMAEHCEHIRDEIYADTSGFYTNLTTYLEDEFEVLRSCIRGESQWMIQRIDSKLDDLADYLKELFEWLADELDFGFIGDDYDDSTVVSWLKRIYLKLGAGDVKTKPVDPVANPFDGWNWLGQLLEQLLTSLSGGAAALAGTLSQLFDGIKTKFPFSIPWDVAAILAVFDAAPVTPAFTIAYTVFGTNVRYDIDMHFFDEQAAVIRAVENVLFCAYLLFKTDWLLNEFNNLGRFIGGKVVGSKG